MIKSQKSPVGESEKSSGASISMPSMAKRRCLCFFFWVAENPDD